MLSSWEMLAADMRKSGTLSHNHWFKPSVQGGHPNQLVVSEGILVETARPVHAISKGRHFVIDPPAKPYPWLSQARLTPRIPQSAMATRQLQQTTMRAHAATGGA